ncbi:BBE domain-containing protein [Bacillus lumedeiriae]|uniref:BBE domain-containing protein n=1 Tax=Bacillus lumedeiriae TaxID=3058829 RepID=UPI00384EBB57
MDRLFIRRTASIVPQTCLYLNGIGASESVTTNAFQQNYDRLVEVKKAYDPNNRFRHNYNISPEGFPLKSNSASFLESQIGADWS